MEPVAACVRAKKPVIDLSADFRLTETNIYEQWYGTPHTSPALLKRRCTGFRNFIERGSGARDWLPHRVATRPRPFCSWLRCWPTG